MQNNEAAIQRVFDKYADRMMDCTGNMSRVGILELALRDLCAELEAERAKLEAVAMPEECPPSTRKLIEFAVIFDTGYELSQSTITDMWFDIRNDIAKLAEPQPKVAP